MNDCIYRQAAIKAIDDLPNCYNGYSDAYDKACVISVLEELPSADVEPIKKGKWIDPAAEDCYRCSVCEEYTKMEMPRLLYHYCPNCGAKMDR